MVRVFVSKHENKGSDNKYHHYYICETDTDFEKNYCIEHSERQNSDGTWTRVGDYMLGPQLWDKDNCIEVKPSDCVPSITFYEHNMVVTLPSHSDHSETGFENSTAVVIDPKIIY